MDIIKDLQEKAISILPNGKKKNIRVIPLSEAIKIAKYYRERSILWAVEDFESRAEDIEGENWREVYDEDEFENALIDMIDNHDCNDGITWQTIDSYLDSHCKK